MKISIDLDDASIGRAIDVLEQYRKSLDEKCMEICRRLADFGVSRASFGFATVEYTGERNIEDIKAVKTANGYEVVANGETILFLEFGAGITYGSGHPQAGEFGMGPGTYPNPKYRMVNGEKVYNWENPKGWYIPGGEHTFGNRPSKAMYNTAIDMREEVERVAKDVFGYD